jgi:hypothetical protein
VLLVAWFFVAVRGRARASESGRHEDDASRKAVSESGQVVTAIRSDGQRSSVQPVAAATASSPPAEERADVRRFRLLGRCVDDASGAPIPAAEIALLVVQDPYCVATSSPGGVIDQEVVIGSSSPDALKRVVGRSWESEQPDYSFVVSAPGHGVLHLRGVGELVGTIALGTIRLRASRTTSAKRSPRRP